MVNGWEVAAIIFGALIAVRIFILGPYWHWQEGRKAADDLAASVAALEAEKVELVARQSDRGARDRNKMADLLLEDRRILADRVSEIEGETLTHPGGKDSFSIFDGAVALRGRFMGEAAFQTLWQAFEQAVLTYLMYAPPIPSGPDDIKAQRAALAHEEARRPAITATAQALTRYLLDVGAD